MQAWVLHGVNDIKYEEVERPKLQPNEVLVQVHAAGVCGSDIPRIYETGAHRHPLIPGHEYAGEVVEQGDDVKGDYRGKAVGIFPLIPCKECIACKNRKYEMCRNYNYLGSRRDGGFAEFVAVPEWNLITLPSNVSYLAAAMMEPMAVATHAMRRVKPKEDENIVICGLGTIGLLLLMILKAGFEKTGGLDNFLSHIYIIGNKDFQKNQALKLGVSPSHYYDAKDGKVEDWILDVTNGIGADVLFECVGKNETICQMINGAAPVGRICLVGNPYSDMTFDKSTYWKILRNQLYVTGTWNSSFDHDKKDDWNYVLDLLKEGYLKPEEMISHKLSLAELEKGLHIMRDKSEDYVKIMVEM